VRLERGNVLVFDYPAKSRKRQVQSVVDPQLHRLVSELKRRRGGGEGLLAFKNDGRWHDVSSSDINEHVRN
jgi:DNA topoisomerase I